jgi:UDPglucose 6-dehydrogenase
MRIICVVGTGYVGLVTGACLAELSNQVTCLDRAVEKIERLRAGELPIYEPALQPLVERKMESHPSSLPREVCFHEVSHRQWG